jgi:hypothetical protein
MIYVKEPLLLKQEFFYRPLLNFTDDVPRLFGTNFDTAYVNQEMLEELEGDIFVFKAKDEGKLLSA